MFLSNNSFLEKKGHRAFSRSSSKESVVKILIPGCRGSASLGGRKPLRIRWLLQRQQLEVEVLLRVNKPLALQVPGTKKISNPRLKIWGPAKIGGFNESPALRTFQYSPEKKGTYSNSSPSLPCWFSQLVKAAIFCSPLNFQPTNQPVQSLEHGKSKHPRASAEPRCWRDLVLRFEAVNLWSVLPASNSTPHTLKSRTVDLRIFRWKKKQKKTKHVHV